MNSTTKPNLELRKFTQGIKGYLDGTVGTWEIWEELEDGSWNLYENNVWSFCDKESLYSQFLLAKSTFEQLWKRRMKHQNYTQNFEVDGPYREEGITLADCAFIFLAGVSVGLIAAILTMGY